MPRVLEVIRPTFLYEWDDFVPCEACGQDAVAEQHYERATGKSWCGHCADKLEGEDE